MTQASQSQPAAIRRRRAPATPAVAAADAEASY